MKRLAALTISFLVLAGPALGGGYPKPESGDFVFKDFRLVCGETLPEVRIHYRTLGKPVRDGKGAVTNAVLILHGTTGQGGNFIRKEFAGELFGRGQPLDTERYFIILPD